MVSKRYLLGAAALASICLLPLTVRRDGVVWELVQLAGLLGAIGCLFLMGASLRPRDARPVRVLTLDQHKWLAWISVALVSAHAGGALLADRDTLEYLKPSMPVYQLAGLVATLAMVIVSITALSRVRKSLWQSASWFRIVHVSLAALIVVLIFIHVIATDRYAAGPRRWLWAAMTILVICLPLARLPTTDSALRWRSVFQNRVKWVGSALALMALACLALAAQKTERRARLTLEPLVSRAEPLMVDFPHERHGTVNCIACHHNFVDGTGVDNCIPCHRSERPDLVLGAEARFHTFCMECHREGALPESDPGKDGPAKHGPVSECSACHRRTPAMHAVYSAPNKKIWAL
jgi:hypothetical protein